MSYIYRSTPEITFFFLYPLSFFLYSPFKKKIKMCTLDIQSKGSGLWIKDIPFKSVQLRIKFLAIQLFVKKII